MCVCACVANAPLSPLNAPSVSKAVVGRLVKGTSTVDLAGDPTGIVPH